LGYIIENQYITQILLKMTDTIKFLKIRDVKNPSRAYDFDAGIDFYVPKFDLNFIKDLKTTSPKLFKTETTGNIALMATSSGTLVYNDPYEKRKDKSIILFDEETGQNYFDLIPGMGVNIPSGIKVRMANPGRALIAHNKSGIATKFGMIVGACVIDYLYQGEVHINVINTSNETVRIYEDMKLIQCIETPVFNSTIEVTDFENDFYVGMSTDRGEKGFGSSDNKQ